MSHPDSRRGISPKASNRSGSYNVLVNALYALAALIFAAASPPALWPGELAFVFAWASFPKARVYFAWASPFFALYLFPGVSTSDMAALQQRSLEAGELTVGLWAFAYSAALAQSRSSRAPLPFLLWAFLMQPSGITLGLALLAWAGWVFVLRRRWSREFGASFSTNWRALQVAALGVLLLAAGLVLLGPISFHHQAAPAPVTTAAPAHSQQAAGKPPPAADEAEPPALPTTRWELPQWSLNLSNWLKYPLGIAALLLLALLLVIWWRVLRLPVERRRAERFPLLLAVISLASITLVVLWFAVVFHGEGNGANAGAGGRAAVHGSRLVGSPNAAPVIVRRAPVGFLMPLAELAVFALLVLLIYLAYQGLRSMDADGEEVEPAAPEPRRGPAFAGRVRTAYREFLRLMLAYAPVSRSETPREYAARLKKRYPAVAVEAFELTRLYEPVRYGGIADEAEAARAEELVRLIAAELEKGREEA